MQRDFYPRSPCGERLPQTEQTPPPFWISIHALLAESDSVTTSFQGGFAISIHALLAESDGRLVYQLLVIGISIHALLAESDHWYHISKNAAMDFYPRSPCGERRKCAVSSAMSNDFYPRSPCGERRRMEHSSTCTRRFLSTLSLRRATARLCWNRSRTPKISIHALLAESDKPKINYKGDTKIFLSTLSLRRATSQYNCTVKGQIISIHALLAESDY